MWKTWIISLIVVGIVVAAFVWFPRGIIRRAFQPTGTIERFAQPEKTFKGDVEIVGQNLEIPWEVVVLPDGDFLVTERSGRLVRIRDQYGIPIEGVQHVGEGGLLGLVLHPLFAQNRLLYIYLTSTQGENLINRVERYALAGTALTDRTIIISDIPGARFHDGGRLAFGPDGFLYITTGDAGNPESAQDIRALSGKILRIAEDGSIPPDNPFGNAVWSYGHRNPQGIAWDDNGTMWATEHGRSGITSGLDEINLIRKGNNYGWPVIEGDERHDGMMSSVLQSGPDVTWAPAGLAIVGHRMFFAGLRGEALYETIIQGDTVAPVTQHFFQQFGRLRAVYHGPENYLLITTSNRDGRGMVREADDKILRVLL